MNPQLRDIHAALGIDADYARQCTMAPQDECPELVETGPDVFGRALYLHPDTARAWREMQAAAAADGVTLQAVSGYRSFTYQQGLFERKLARGERLEDILRVNAAPGFSEHHSGRAMDLGCPECPHLEEVFEASSAFAWLSRHAADFGFSLSFPRNNPHGVLYEPWHWFHGAR